MADSKHDFIENVDDYPRWKESFTQEQRESMMDEDVYVGRAIPYLLTGLVVVGLVLASIAIIVTSYS